MQSGLQVTSVLCRVHTRRQSEFSSPLLPIVRWSGGIGSRQTDCLLTLSWMKRVFRSSCRLSVCVSKTSSNLLWPPPLLLSSIFFLFLWGVSRGDKVTLILPKSSMSGFQQCEQQKTSQIWSFFNRIRVTDMLCVVGSQNQMQLLLLKIWASTYENSLNPLPKDPIEWFFFSFSHCW